MSITRLLSCFSKSLQKPVETSNSDDKFILENSREIICLLEEIKRKRILVKLATIEESYSLAVFIVEIHPTLCTVIIDFFTKVASDHPILSSHSIMAKANLDGVECAFLIENISVVSLDAGTAFSFKFPLKMLWPQLRNFLRTIIPISHHDSYCEMRLPRLNGKLIKLALYDLHAQGFSMLITKPNLSSLFVVNDIINGLIHLPSRRSGSCPFQGNAY